MADLGRLLKPAGLLRIVVIYLVLMGLYATGTHAFDQGFANGAVITLGMTAVMTVATVAVVFALLVASRGGVAAWQAGRMRASGQVEGALERYNRALGANPNRPEALVGRAELLAAAGKAPGALADLDRAIAETPHVSNFPDPILYRAYLERGRLREGANDLTGAVADWAQASRVAPGAPDPYVLRGRAGIENGDWYGGRRDLLRGVELLAGALQRMSGGPGRAALLNMRGLAFNLLGEHRRALADLEQSVQLQPDSWVTHYNIGATYVNLGHPDQALAELKQAILLNPTAAATARTSHSYAALRDDPAFGALVGA